MTADSRQVIGTVCARDGDDDIYIIPLESILQQMKVAFDADNVCLPRGSTNTIRKLALELGSNVEDSVKEASKPVDSMYQLWASFDPSLRHPPAQYPRHTEGSTDEAYYSLGARSELALGDTHEPSHLIQAKKEQILRWQADQKAHTPTFEISQPSSPQTMGPGARAFLNFAPYPPLTTTTLPSQSASFPPATSRPYASGTSFSSVPLAGSAQFHTGLMLPPTTEASNKKHKCPYCATEFTRHHNLKSHLLTHAEEKPYVCSTCQSRFRRLHDLKRHTKLHTGERSHSCPVCGRKFARGDALERHSKGPGGCAGRRASLGSIGGDDDEYDEYMEGIMYAEPEHREENGPQSNYSIQRIRRPDSDKISYDLGPKEQLLTPGPSPENIHDVELPPGSSFSTRNPHIEFTLTPPNFEFNNLGTFPVTTAAGALVDSRTSSAETQHQGHNEETRKGFKTTRPQSNPVTQLKLRDDDGINFEYLRSLSRFNDGTLNNP